MLKMAELSELFIDDIFWVLLGKQQTEPIKCHLQKVFEDVYLATDVRQVNTNDTGDKV